MKNNKAIKLTLIALSLVLIIGAAVGIFASAEGEELSVEINARNISYGDVIKVLFAVDDTNAGGNDVEILYYLDDPQSNPDAKAYKGTPYDKGYTEDGVTYPAFFTAAFPSKDIGEQVYAQAHIVDTDIYSEIVRYSVVEYLLERLYVDMATGDKKALYQDLLSYGASAQRVLINGNDDPADDVTNFITDYVLVAIEGGTLDGKYSQGIYFPGVDKVYPQADGVATWNATVFDLTTGAGTTTEVSGGAVYDVTGFTMFTPASQGEAPAPAYKPDLTDTVGRILWSESNNISDYKSAGAIDHYINKGASAPVLEDGAPYGESSKVVKMESLGTSGTQDQFFINNTAAYANAYKAAFETDIMVDAKASCLYEITIRKGSDVAYTLKLGVSADGNGQISGSGLETVSAPGVSGNWFRLRAEYITVSDTQVKVAVYYNDMKIAETAPFNATIKATDITRIIISASSTSVGAMYLTTPRLVLLQMIMLPTSPIQQEEKPTRVAIP
jgi:hypothetical protein